MPTTDVTAFVRGALPAAPARVLEVGAGDGTLAADLAEAGYDVLAIDPAGEQANVAPVALLDVAGDVAPFDAAVAVLSLHHVEPLEPSCRRLAELVRPGGRLIVDELDVERLDDAALRWWSAQREAIGAEQPQDTGAMVAGMRAHLHPVRRLVETLSPWFALGEPVRGAYLHRWHLEPGLRDAEERLVAAGRLPAVGARLVGVRRPDR
jgi:SAM-dependent methyltransferase